MSDATLLRPRAHDLDESALSKAFRTTPGLAPTFLIVALVVAAGLSLVFGFYVEQPPVPVDTSTWIVTAGLFIGALAIERMTELLIAPWVGDLPGKASRSVVIGSIAAVLGVVVAGALGLYLLEILTDDVIHTSAPGQTPEVDKSWIRSIDILVTAMAIAGGTKPLHDLLSSLEKRTQKKKDEVSKAAPDIATLTPPPDAAAAPSTTAAGEPLSATPYRHRVTVTGPAADEPAVKPLMERIAAIKRDIARIVPGSTVTADIDVDATLPSRPTDHDDSSSTRDDLRRVATLSVDGSFPFRAGTPSYTNAVYETAYRLAAAGYWVEPELASPASITISKETTSTLPAVQNRRWALDQMQLTDDDIADAKGGAGILVGHPDTGYRPHEHEPNWDLDKGYDVIDDDEDPIDPLLDAIDILEPDVVASPGHGTSTSSIIAGRVKTPDGDGDAPMHAVAPEATVVPYRAMRGPVHLFDSDVADAVRRAVDAGCRVISMSLGGFGFTGLRDEIKRAYEQGVIVVAATGNQVGIIVSPADYPETIAASSSKANGRPFSEGASQGPFVTITAPGTDVWRVGVDDDGSTHVSTSTGTSYATAHVAGVAALWLSKHADAIDKIKVKHDIPRTFAHLLRTTATPWPREEDTFGFGPGIVNAGALLNAKFTGDDAPTEDELQAALPTEDPESAIVKTTAIAANLFVGEGTNDLKAGIVEKLVDWLGGDADKGKEAAGADAQLTTDNVQAVVRLEAAHHYRTDGDFRSTLNAPGLTTPPAAATREFRELVGATNAADGNPSRGEKSKALRRALAGKTSVRGRYKWIGLALLALAAILSFMSGYWFGVDDPIGIATTTAAMVTAFYVGAQALERIVEFTFGRAVFYQKPDRGTERALILLGITITLGCLLAAFTGFRIIEALAGTQDVDHDAFSRSVSVFVTGLAIGGGTKPLHDLITRIRVRSAAA